MCTCRDTSSKKAVGDGDEDDEGRAGDSLRDEHGVIDGPGTLQRLPQCRLAEESKP